MMNQSQSNSPKMNHSKDILSVINIKNMVRFLSVVIAGMLIGLGIWTGGYVDILHKATTICLECIGIG